jgi:hypothetical protein
MPATRAIAKRSIDLLTPVGKRIPFRVEFGPICRDGQDFRCRVRFRGWGNSPQAMRGYDSLQAFTFAVELVYVLLGAFVKRGGRVVWPGTTDDYDLGMFISQAKTAELVVEPDRRQRRLKQSAVAKTAASG